MIIPQFIQFLLIYIVARFFCLLSIMLLCQHMVSVFLNKYLEVEFLSYRVGIGLYF